MTDEEIQGYLGRMNEMSHQQMAWLWRFAPGGNPYFDRRRPLARR